MRGLSALATIALWLVVSSSAPAQDLASEVEADLAAFQRLLAARSLRCTFPKGSYGAWKDGKVEVKPAEFESPMVFDSIDYQTGKARLIANQGAGDIQAVSSPGAVFFVETTMSGGLNVTFVFSDTPVSRREFLAVTTRHLIVPGQPPLPSQYHGTCKIWE